LPVCTAGDGISGLDVSPNGRRLATCGSAPQIVIWNMLPILDERAEQDASVPKILATIQDSSGSVLTVRFSHCGSMLAAGCGGDADSAVLIFKQSSVPATQTLGMGGSKLPNIENWRPVATLRGHSLDVTALSWSPGDEFLASASMDGNVLIWGMNAGGCCSCCAPLVVLAGASVLLLAALRWQLVQGGLRAHRQLRSACAVGMRQQPAAGST
jgi:protein HIRA/HIR1